MEWREIVFKEAFRENRTRRENKFAGIWSEGLLAFSKDRRFAISLLTEDLETHRFVARRRKLLLSLLLLKVRKRNTNWRNLAVLGQQEKNDRNRKIQRGNTESGNVFHHLETSECTKLTM